MVGGCPLVVHYWAVLQPVHGFRCYGNITPNAKCCFVKSWPFSSRRHWRRCRQCLNVYHQLSYFQFFIIFHLSSSCSSLTGAMQSTPGPRGCRRFSELVVDDCNQGRSQNSCSRDSPSLLSPPSFIFLFLPPFPSFSSFPSPPQSGPLIQLRFWGAL